QRVTPQVKAHLSVLVGLLALVKAVDYWLAQYSLTLSKRGFVEGATYTDVKAQLPALRLLIVIALLAFGLFIYNIWRRGWTWPVLAVGLWALVAIIAGTAYPAFIQAFRVKPSESSREAPYIANNIQATRQAMKLDNVQTQRFDYQSSLDSAAKAVVDNQATIRNIRLLDPNVVKDSYQKLQSPLSDRKFNDLDVDRYPITLPDGKTVAPTEVVISSRDLNQPGIPQQSWEGQHVSYTHGYGVALSPANAVTTGGSPDFLVHDVPTKSESDRIDFELTKPQIYFSENLTGYSIVGAAKDEVDYLDTNGSTVGYRYAGKGGVAMGSLLRRAAFSLRLGTMNPLISNLVTKDSKVLYIRDIPSRVHAVAPFLKFDHDPYPVVVDGRIQYVVDAYTTTDRFPNAQAADTGSLNPASGLKTGFNYVRNSVKAVVDAYDGTVTMYVIDPTDPIIQAYSSAFPTLFTSMDQMPDALRAHLRYPEDLFKVQTAMWGQYHIEDPQSFYNPSN
ncbi:MAG: UPF0182 family protein, partial [Ilumatobacteraceae bacterium]